MAKNKTHNEDFEPLEPTVLNMCHRPHCRGQCDGSDRTKERFRPATKHEATDDELFHDRPCNAAADQQDEQTSGSLDAEEMIERGLISTKSVCNHPLSQHEHGHDGQSAHQFTWARP